MAQIAEIENLIVDDLVKGVPGGVEPFPLREVGTKGWNILAEDLPLPVAVLKRSALFHNGRWMADFLKLSGAVIAPHGKTTMSPQLFDRQLADGAWAITLATVHQIQVARHFGVDRVVLANQLVGRQAIRYVLDELARDPGFEFYCLVDSVDGVEILARAARAHPVARPLNLLLEGGTFGGRTGCRDQATALEVARAVAVAAPDLALRGVEGFEGLIHGNTDAEQDQMVSEFITFLAGIAGACAREGLFADGPVLLSAGGSAFYDLVVDGFGRAEICRETILLTRSGSTRNNRIARAVTTSRTDRADRLQLTLLFRVDKDFFARLETRTPAVAQLGEGLKPALQLWAYVQSRPEAEKTVLTLGRRDASFDAGPPVPELWFRPGTHARPAPFGEGCTVTELNDQHTHMTVPAESPLAVGDMVAFGVSHPCTTFDKWQYMFVVDDNYRVVSAIRTFF